MWFAPTQSRFLPELLPAPHKYNCITSRCNAKELTWDERYEKFSARNAYAFCHFFFEWKTSSNLITTDEFWKFLCPECECAWEHREFGICCWLRNEIKNRRKYLRGSVFRRNENWSEASAETGCFDNPSRKVELLFSTYRYHNMVKSCSRELLLVNCWVKSHQINTLYSRKCKYFINTHVFVSSGSICVRTEYFLIFTVSILTYMLERSKKGKANRHIRRQATKANEANSSSGKFPPSALSH